MNPEPEKRLRTGSFSAHAARGIIRDPAARRKVMFALLFAAVLLVVAGSTFLQDFLHAREHPMRFIVFWVACAWVMITALLLALLDLLTTRARARTAERMLREQLLREDEKR